MSAEIVSKLTSGTDAISALLEQAKRFDAMSVQIAKSADLATSQADEIAMWTSKLIDAVAKIRKETQYAAAARRGLVQDKIRTLKAQADSTKRKILDSAELDSLRTIKANFRLIFGPPKDKASSNLSNRINVIRDLCESHFHGVIALSTSYSTKVWAESTSEVFDGLIKLLKDEKEQDWPVEIVGIMDELERERPMSAEFRDLRTKISQLQGRRRPRLGECVHLTTETAPLPPVQTDGLATQTLYGQYTSAHLPSLQQMALLAPSSNRDQTQALGYRHESTTDSRYNGTGVGVQHLPPQQYGQRNPAVDHALPPSRENREMKDMYTNAPASHISKVPEPFRTAIKNSRLWKWERSVGLKTTGCWPSLFPKDYTQDVSFTIWCGNKDGEYLTDFFGGKSEMSS